MILECLALSAGVLMGGGALCLSIGEHPNEKPGRMRRDLIAYFQTGAGGMLLVCALMAWK